MIQTSCLKSLLTVLALGLTSSVFGAVEGGTGLRPLVAAFHVHSSVSTGGLSLDQLAEQAETLGLEAVILSDNFVLHYE